MKKLIAFMGFIVIWSLLPMFVNAMTQDQLKAFLDREEIKYTDEQIETYFPLNQIQDYEYVAYIEWDANNPQGHGMRFYFTDLDDLEWIMKNDAFGYGHGTTFQSNGSRLRGVYYDSQVGFVNSEYNWTNNAEMYVVVSPSTYISNGISYLNIDFDTIYYNPQIPVPKLDIWYLLTLNSYLRDYDAVVNANIDVPDSTEFYIELAWKWSVPEQIRVYSSDIKGTAAYDYGYYSSSDLKSIYNLQDMQPSINVHVKGEDLKQEWQSFYDDYYDTITFYTEQNNVPSGWLANARLKYITKMGTQLPMYGNRLEVFARYWTISEDNKVVVGKWYHWQSASGSVTEVPPENYINYQPLPGYSGTVENVPTDNQNTYDGVGVETGIPAQTVIQYAPNYPDYPTVASYNKDNLLVASITKLNEIKEYFGEFNDFLTVSFVWVPDWIWALIGIGFSLSIIVFFLRML